MAATARRQSLLEALEAVPDPRSRHGRRYSLASVLAMAVCAMACGARSVCAIAQWGRLHRQLVRKVLGIGRLTAPSHPQLHRIFTRLDVAAFEGVLGQWLAQRGLRAKEGIAVDFQDVARHPRRGGAGGASGVGFHPPQWDRAGTGASLRQGRSGDCGGSCDLGAPGLGGTYSHRRCRTRPTRTVHADRAKKGHYLMRAARQSPYALCGDKAAL